MTFALLAASYSALGRPDEAKAQIEKSGQIAPAFTLGLVPNVASYKISEDLENLSFGYATPASRNNRFGSRCGLWRDRQEGPLPEVKRKESVGKRTRPLDGRLPGVERTYRDQGLNRRFSQELTLRCARTPYLDGARTWRWGLIPGSILPN